MLDTVSVTVGVSQSTAARLLRNRPAGLAAVEPPAALAHTIADTECHVTFEVGQGRALLKLVGLCCDWLAWRFAGMGWQPAENLATALTSSPAAVFRPLIAQLARWQGQRPPRVVVSWDHLRPLMNSVVEVCLKWLAGSRQVKKTRRRPRQGGWVYRMTAPQAERVPLQKFRVLYREHRRAIEERITKLLAWRPRQRAARISPPSGG